MKTFYYSLLLAGLGLLPAGADAQSATSQASITLMSLGGPDMLADTAAHYLPAVYPGGTTQLLKTIQQAVRYPMEALRAKAEGRVLVSFQVDEVGKVGLARVVSSPSPLLNEEVLRAVQALGTFAPAQKNGQPVSSTYTCPVVFRITQPVVVAVAKPTAAQPVALPAAGNLVVDKLVSLRDSAYWTVKGVSTTHVYQHYFTYDRLGRPATHTELYRTNGKLTSSQVLTFEYDKAGRLAAKVGGQRRYTFHYSPTGELRGIKGSFRTPKGWITAEETTLTEKSTLPDGTRLMGLEVTYTRLGKLVPSMGIDYLLAADHTVRQTTMYRRNGQLEAPPRTIHYTYDTHPNPQGNLLLERWYQLQNGLGGPHNPVQAQTEGRSTSTSTYDYNAAGLPTQAVDRYLNGKPRQIVTFTYAPIVVPAPAGMAAEAVASVTIAPNPASATTVIRAASIGPGEATLRLRDAATGQLRRQTVHAVAGTFEATISVAGLERGVYLVEVANGPAVANGRLVVE